MVSSTPIKPRIFYCMKVLSTPTSAPPYGYQPYYPPNGYNTYPPAVTSMPIEPAITTDTLTFDNQPMPSTNPQKANKKTNKKTRGYTVTLC